jgi:hypothetical protein
LKLIYSGPVGSGKTAALINKYLELVEEGIRSDRILVLTRSTLDVSRWRRELKAPALGKLNVHTYFGFVQEQLTSYWPMVEDRLPGRLRFSLPVFMTVEASHYLMMQLVEEKLDQGGFRDVRSTSDAISIQLIDNLNLAAVSKIPLEKAFVRLRLLGAVGGAEKQAAFRDAIELMKRFRENCLQNRSIDYSLMVELYNDILFSDERYLARLHDSYHYLIVDDIDETVPVAQDLIVDFLKKAKGVFLAYNPRGGHTDFFGAYPEGVEKNILPLCMVQEQKNENFEGDMEVFASSLEGILRGKTADVKSMALLSGQIVEDLRGAMLEEVANRITKLVESGTKPGEIAVISPFVDKVLEFDLGHRLAERGIELEGLSRSRRLLDQPFAQAMVTLAALCHRQWQISLNYSALVQCMGLLLELDPIRAGLLAERIMKNDNNLPDIDEEGLRDRIGYRNAEKYQELYEWVKSREGQEDADLRLLFQQIFAELLAPLSPEKEDLLAVRQVLDSATKVHKALERYHGDAEDVDRCFIDLVQKGTLAADMLHRPKVERDKVILTTALNFVLNPNIAAVDYQFWVDIGSRYWMRGIAKELTNPWVLSRRWSKGMVWDDGLDQKIRVERLARLIRGLLCKCEKGIYIAHSQLSSQGFEQDGILLEAFEVLMERGSWK